MWNHALWYRQQVPLKCLYKSTRWYGVTTQTTAILIHYHNHTISCTVNHIHPITRSHSLSLTYVLISSYHQCLCLPSDHLPSGFLTKIWYALLTSHIQTISLSHHLWNSYLCIFQDSLYRSKSCLHFRLQLHNKWHECAHLKRDTD